MTVFLESIASTVAADIKAFRSSAVTSEGKGNTAARSMLAALLSGVWTQSLAESALIHAFGNPKSPKTGKPVAKLSGLRDFTGGDAVRKAAETVFRIFANVDADAPRTVDDVTVGAGTIRPLVVSFVLNETDAPKSLRALNEAVNVALREHAKAISPDNADAVAETEAESAAPTTSTEAAFDVADAIAKLTVFASAMDEADANAYSDAINTLYAAWDARCNELTDAAPEALAA